MSDAPDPLDGFECGLARLRPAGLSDAVRARIGARLAPRRRLWWTAAGLAAALSVAVVWRAAAPERIGLAVPTHSPAIAEYVPTTHPPTPPARPRTMAAYRRALAEGPDELDRLLTRDAAEVLAGGSSAAVSAVLRNSPELTTP